MEWYELLGPVGAGIGAAIDKKDIGPAMLRGLMPGMNLLSSMFQGQKEQPLGMSQKKQNRRGQGGLMQGLHGMNNGSGQPDGAIGGGFDSRMTTPPDWRQMEIPGQMRWRY